MTSYIGVDIGGTKIHAARINKAGKILDERFLDTEARKGKKHVLARIMLIISELISKDVKGIGIGCPGPLDIKKGKVLNTPNLPLRNVELKDIVAKKFRMKVVLDNDASCFVLGEAVYGAGKNFAVVAGITMGTGIGGGIVINRKIFSGRNSAGEFGHMTINFGGIKGKDGHIGCLESYVGKFAIIERAKKIGFENPYELYKAAIEGNKKAREIWNDVGFYLGVGIANVLCAVDPDVVVLGGNVAGAWQFFNAEMKRAIKKKSVVGMPLVVKSKLGSKAAVLGAAKLVM